MILRFAMSEAMLLEHMPALLARRVNARSSTRNLIIVKTDGVCELQIICRESPALAPAHSA
jgi:hypothetical protein